MGEEYRRQVACAKQSQALQKAFYQKDAYGIKQAMKVNGVRFKWMDPELREATRQKMVPAWDKWVKRTGGDAESVLKEVNEFHDAYMKK
jgi:hypothetical protein